LSYLDLQVHLQKSISQGNLMPGGAQETPFVRFAAGAVPRGPHPANIPPLEGYSGAFLELSDSVQEISWMVVKKYRIRLFRPGEIREEMEQTRQNPCYP
jgi:hypothetical protein